MPWLVNVEAIQTYTTIKQTNNNKKKPGALMQFLQQSNVYINIFSQSTEFTVAFKISRETESMENMVLHPKLEARRHHTAQMLLTGFLTTFHS